MVIEEDPVAQKAELTIPVLERLTDDEMGRVKGTIPEAAKVALGLLFELAMWEKEARSQNGESKTAL